MKIFLLFVIMLLLMPCLSNAQYVSVGISEVLKTEAVGIEYNSPIKAGELFKVSFELHNSGSVGYEARARVDILNQSNLLYTGWSDEKPFHPGTRHRFEVYWHPVAVGKFTAEVRVYFANEIEKIKSLEFEVKNLTIPERAFEITNFKTYEDEVEFIVKTNQTLENIVIIPLNYPLGWVFEQARIERMNKDDVKKVTLEYKPSLWKPSEITIDIVTEDGKYCTTESFPLKKESGFRQFLHYFSKILRKYLPIIL